MSSSSILLHLLAAGFLAGTGLGAQTAASAPPAQSEPAPRPAERGLPVWHPHEFVFDTGATGNNGATLTESGSDPFNPWLNWRLNARFTSPSGEVLDVPGFYAGNADGSGVGDAWKVRFAPGESGQWTLEPQFEYAETAINVEPLDVSGTQQIPLPVRRFWVEPLDASAPGFLSKGPLRNTGQHYLCFPDGTPWLKGGTNSPENFLGYAGFDGAQDAGGFPLGRDFLHRYPSHEADWNPGDPDWSSGGNPNAGRGIIGALNYLASEGVNSIYFLPNNLGGDCQDAFPFVSPFGGDFLNTRWDASRMEQWNTVMEHATRKGILLHVVLAEQETENVNWLGFSLGVQRKLFFKNLIAMFGHNLGMKFNFCEENSAAPGDEFSPAELREFADYFALWDTYDHPLSVHTDADDQTLYEQILSQSETPSWLTSASLQLHCDYGAQVEATRALSSLNGGVPLIVDQDEQGSPLVGLSATNAAQRRKEVLYDVYLSGGNIEWYCGINSLPLGGDFDLEDFRTRQDMWRFMRTARELLESLPFERMAPDDGLVTGEDLRGFGEAEVFAERGGTYLVYFPRVLNGGDLDLTHIFPPTTLSGVWINPRTGLVESPTFAVPGGTVYSLPAAPGDLFEDWIFLVQAD